MIIDGKQIADDILASLGDSLRGKTLGVVVGQGNPATDSFVKIKERVAERLGVRLIKFPADRIMQALGCDAVIVQLPIEGADALLAHIPTQKDIDALGPEPAVTAPVAVAVREILQRTGVAVRNKKAVVVGEGPLVGKPVAKLLHALGARVFSLSLEHGSLETLKDAEIIVSGAGSPGLIKPEMLQNGVALIDAGTSESGGKLVGDCDPACATVANVFTPVPGGVGPIAIACLFKNFATLQQGKVTVKNA